MVYNFLSTSPLGQRWRVMKRYLQDRLAAGLVLPQHLADGSDSGACADQAAPAFDLAKHGLLLSECKQLYVLATRGKEQVLFYEENEELSRPMRELWRALGIIQVSHL